MTESKIEIKTGNRTLTVHSMAPRKDGTARMKAATNSGISLTVEGTDHDEAATAVLNKLEWTGVWISGPLGEDARVYVQV